MTDRRYDDEEVSAIFARAAENPQAAPLQTPRSEGLTLVELQEIGREVGIAPDAVALAARSLDLQPRALAQTFLGLPIGVGRTIDLERKLTDAEWELLVVELREVFQARGKVSQNGSFRQWTNGNLQALLEPTPTGHRLRLSTFKANARASMAVGFASLGTAAALGIASAVSGQLAATATPLTFLSFAGLALIANGALRLPGWARLRREQMDAIAAGVALHTNPDATI